MQARHEYKHRLNHADYIVLRDRLRRTMQRDIHADENGEYTVRSLYFDTPDDKALRQKINGVDRREKFRVRRYVGTDSLFVLEKKSKRHGLCYKRNCVLTRAEVQLLQSGSVGWMALDERELVQEFYAKSRYEQLRPKTIVQYVREPFVCSAGNVRITLDREVRTGLFSTDFLSDDLPLVKADDGIVLLEVKYDQFIPDYIVRLLQLENRGASACSKYALCRIYG
jgi:hypothetical protein